MYKELFRTKLESKSLENVKKAFQEATGEEDFMGFAEEDDENAYIKKLLNNGFIEFHDNEMIVFADGE